MRPYLTLLKRIFIFAVLSPFVEAEGVETQIYEPDALVRIEAPLYISATHQAPKYVAWQDRYVNDVIFSEDGKHALILSQNFATYDESDWDYAVNQLTLLDLDTFQQVAGLRFTDRYIEDAKFSKGRVLLFSSSDDPDWDGEPLRHTVLDVPNLKVISDQILQAELKDLPAATYSADDEYLVSRSAVMSIKNNRLIRKDLDTETLEIASQRIIRQAGRVMLTCLEDKLMAIDMVAEQSERLGLCDDIYVDTAIKMPERSTDQCDGVCAPPETPPPNHFAEDVFSSAEFYDEAQRLKNRNNSDRDDLQQLIFRDYALAQKGEIEDLPFEFEYRTQFVISNRDRIAYIDGKSGEIVVIEAAPFKVTRVKNPTEDIFWVGLDGKRYFNSEGGPANTSYFDLQSNSFGGFEDFNLGKPAIPSNSREFEVSIELDGLSVGDGWAFLYMSVHEPAFGFTPVYDHFYLWTDSGVAFVPNKSLKALSRQSID